VNSGLLESGRRRVIPEILFQRFDGVGIPLSRSTIKYISCLRQALSVLPAMVSERINGEDCCIDLNKQVNGLVHGDAETLRSRGVVAVFQMDLPDLDDQMGVRRNEWRDSSVSRFEVRGETEQVGGTHRCS